MEKLTAIQMYISRWSGERCSRISRSMPPVDVRLVAANDSARLESSQSYARRRFSSLACSGDWQLPLIHPTLSIRKRALNSGVPGVKCLSAHLRSGRSAKPAFAGAAPLCLKAMNRARAR